MESPQPVIEPVKKNQTPLIVAAVAIVLCCCCLVLAVAGYYFFGISRSVTQPEFPLVATPDTQIPTTNPGDNEVPATDIGEAPTGGLGNDILRNDTWTYVAAAAQGQGCDQPLGAETTIDVLQQPQNGVWVEQWNVACASGDTYSYEIEFTLDDTGATFNIKSLQ